jgi:two-component system, OmpR family, sensor histidine kinase QseC
MTRRRYSIRRRMIISTLVSMLAILGGIGFAVSDSARHESEEIFDARLATFARVLETLVAHQLEKASISNPIVIALPEELLHTEGDEPRAAGHPYETKIAFQVWHDDGTLLAKSSSAPDKALGRLQAGYSTHQIDGQIWQVFALHSGQVWILAAEKNEIRDEMAEYLAYSILGPLAAGGILLIIAVNLILAFNMRSLRDLADTISKREPESLALIELPETPVELEPIVDELNDLLVRVKTTFEREQRFIDSAAHEIRTPIAALQIHIQNAIRARTEQERDASLRNALDGLRRTTKLAEQLLTYSRLTGKIDQETLREVSLNRICHEVIAVEEPLLAERGQTIALEADHELLVFGESYKLQRLLQNLVDNASQYGSPQGEILLKLERSGNDILLSVANDGDPIRDEELGKIFTPYYRIPENGSSGSGLGLAIVKEIAEQHHAKIKVRRNTGNQGTVVTIRFPATAEP